jgi:hypothetical protein
MKTRQIDWEPLKPLYQSGVRNDRRNGARAEKNKGLIRSRKTANQNKMGNQQPSSLMGEGSTNRG